MLNVTVVKRLPSLQFTHKELRKISVCHVHDLLVKCIHVHQSQRIGATCSCACKFAKSVSLIGGS